jgi:hypothetical protein
MHLISFSKLDNHIDYFHIVFQLLKNLLMIILHCYYIYCRIHFKQLIKDQKILLLLNFHNCKPYILQNLYLYLNKYLKLYQNIHFIQKIIQLHQIITYKILKHRVATLHLYNPIKKLELSHLY